MNIKGRSVRSATYWLALLLGSWFLLSLPALAGIQGRVFVHNQTGLIIEVQINGRYRGVIDPNDIATYDVGDAAERVTELYAEDASTGYYWSKTVASAEADYDWYVHD